MAATLYFEKLKEHRGDYFVEYHPPVSANQFATLTLVHHDDKIPLDLADVMVRELQYWLTKYPVPVMVSASDAANSHIKPKEFDGDGLFDGFLVGWIDPVSKDPAWSWAIDDLTKFNEQHPYQGDWRSIYTPMCHVGLKKK